MKHLKKFEIFNESEDLGGMGRYQFLSDHLENLKKLASESKDPISKKEYEDDIKETKLKMAKMSN